MVPSSSRKMQAKLRKGKNNIKDMRHNGYAHRDNLDICPK